MNRRKGKTGNLQVDVRAQVSLIARAQEMVDDWPVPMTTAHTGTGNRIAPVPSVINADTIKVDAYQFRLIKAFGVVASAIMPRVICHIPVVQARTLDSGRCFRRASKSLIWQVTLILFPLVRLQRGCGISLFFEKPNSKKTCRPPQFFCEFSSRMRT